MKMTKSIRLSNSANELLEDISSKQGRSMSDIVEEGIVELAILNGDKAQRKIASKLRDARRVLRGA